MTALTGLHTSPNQMLNTNPFTVIRPHRAPDHELDRFKRWLAFSDMLCITAAILTAQILRFGSSAEMLEVSSWSVEYVAFSVSLGILWFLTLNLQRTRDTRIVGDGWHEYGRVLDSTVKVFVVIACVELLLHASIARGYIAIALPLGTSLLFVSRFLWRQRLNARRQAGELGVPTLIVGQLNDVKGVLQKLEGDYKAGYIARGAALTEGCPTSLDHLTMANLHIESTHSIGDVCQLVGRLQVATVIATGKVFTDGSSVQELAWMLERQHVELIVTTEVSSVAERRIHWRAVRGLPLLHIGLPRFDGWTVGLKRAFDIASSALAIMLLSPLFLVLSLLIAIDSTGPVFFRQNRVGQHGQMFQMVKFRSMRVDAEEQLAQMAHLDEGNGLLFKMREDPRVTRIGRVLRKYSLDELPQLLNVLLGQMSLVGPRPPLPKEVAGYEMHVNRRLLVKPGITGLWQISGRSDLSWEESTRLDLYYVENWSLFKDLSIILRTFGVLIKPTGAY